MAQQQFNQIQHNYHRQPMKLSKAGDRERRYKFHLNDHIDILIEILKRLDGRSLSVAACVCRLWCTIARSDSLWENLCFRQVSPPPSGVRPVVVALGGYRRLYMVCVRPVLSRLGDESGRTGRRVWSREEVQLSLSLFCVDYYERLGVGERFGNASPSSLLFL
ncbi:F-box protein SNE-like [Tripterygium wilfordii]|uniref:F-box protein SNE-like n=1 Tax=Tripterygium wilfordii TaxID=458696 RepID=UPI0018F81421|nr:F-box protein SNE-like [Tripterygium wilfordii]